MSKAVRGIALIAVAYLAACAAISQQKAQTTQADNLVFHNLRVLPPNITHDELIATMRGFARGLGVRCNHCHVPNPPDAAEEFEYPSDAKREKSVARTMLRMVREVNAQYVSRVNEHGETVGCMTCHRGHTVPEVGLTALPPGSMQLPGKEPEPRPAPQPSPQPPR